MTERPQKYDPGHHMHKLDTVELAELHQAVRLYFVAVATPGWLMAKIDARVALAWLCVHKGPLVKHQLVDGLYGIVSALEIYEDMSR